MLIGISGKIGSGKDTIGKIIQYLTAFNNHCGDRPSFNSFLDGHHTRFVGKLSGYEIKKFADKLKDIVCLLIGCTREQLEDQEFKNKPLGEEWIRYSYATGFTKDNNGNTTMLSTQCSKEKYEEEFRINWQTAYKTVLTPRILLQYIGTDLLRDKLHENVHINALFSDYRTLTEEDKINFFKQLGIDDYQVFKRINYDDYLKAKELFFRNNIYKESFWIITDLRFPNELKAIKDRGGITIRVNTDLYGTIDGNVLPSYKVPKEEQNKYFTYRQEKEHLSETALDNAEFDHVIDNNGTIEELIEKVKEILIKERIL